MNFTRSESVRRALIAAFSAIVIVASSATTAWAQGDTLLGTWKLIPEKSTFSSASSPVQSMTLKFSATDAGLMKHAKGMDAGGNPIETDSVVIADGRYHPVTGTSRFDSSSYTQLSDRNTVYLRQRGGTIVVVGSRVVSGDGKMLTFREKTVDKLGRETGKALLVFEKQASPQT